VSDFSYLCTHPLTTCRLWSAHGRDVSTFAKNTLGVAAVKSDFGSAAVDMLKIPWIYGWSEGVLGRPEDWVDHIGMSLGASGEGHGFANR
jgi:hypothetical protein